MISSKIMQATLAPALTLCVWLAVACTPASALVEHELLGTFHQVPESSILITDAVDNSGGASKETST